MTLTAAGLQLETKAQTGATLHFTRVALGDGQLAQGQILSALSDLISHKLNLPITTLDVTGTGTARMQTVLQNSELQIGFFAREIGVYATDPDVGEILYAVANAGDMADYIPAGGGADVVELILEVVTVVGQAETVTANINTSLLFTTQVESFDHYNSTDPHPNAPSLRAATASPTHFWGQVGGDNHLHPVSLDAAKAIILGGDGADISIMRGRIDQTEREMANIALRLEAEGIYPDYNTLLAEDFKIPDLVDQFSCDITSIVAGDDSIDVSTLRGIVPGAWYTISDGVGQERCQVKSVVKNGSTYRLIMMAAVINTYVSGQVTMYRTTAQIQTNSGQAEGSGDRRSAVWQPALVWTGINSNTSATLPLVTTASNAGAFTASGDIGYTADGAVTLV